MTSANPQHVRVSAPVRGWRGFRHWRRTRPYWGGKLTILAGLQIFGTTQMSLGGLSFQMGPTGFLSWLIPTILVACGLLMWFTPQHRMFYAIIASMTAVFSLIAVNLGGFMIGMLLGMVGGALGFAWTPAPAPTPVADDDGHADDGDDDGRGTAPTEEIADGPLPDVLPRPRDPLTEPAYQESAYDDPTYAQPGQDAPQIPASRPGEPPEGQPPGHGQSLPRRSPRLLAITLVLLGVSATGVTAVYSGPPALAAPPCAPVPTPTASTSGASTSSPAPTTSPTAPAEEGAQDGNLLTDIIDGVADVLGIGDEEPAPAAEPSPTPAAQSGAEAAEEAVAPTPTQDPAATPSPDGQPEPSGEPTPTQKPKRAKPARQPGTCPEQSVDPRPGVAGVKRLSTLAGQPRVAKKPSLLTGSKVTMYGLKLDGIVNLPTVDGTIEALQFSMRKAVTDDFLLQVPGPGGRTTRFETDALTVQGDVKFYASRFVGRILGIEVTLTPSSPVPPDGIPLALPVISFNDPEMELVFVNSTVLTGRPTLKVSLA